MKTVISKASARPSYANATKVTICVDADGGDDAPSVVTEGLRAALAEDPELNILLVGRQESVSELGSQFPDRVQTVVTTQVIGMGDHPAEAVRRMKDSSIVVGCKMVHEGVADGFFSAGSTGACVTAASVIIGRIKGVSRPAMATVVPVPGKNVLLLDCGANSNCRPSMLVQFAQMGGAYMQSCFDIANPTVGLLSNGEEETKGNELVVEAHELMKQKIPGFIGNVEGGTMLEGHCNVVVCDGFSGNVALKVIEGTSKLLFKNVKGIMCSSLLNKLAGAKLSKPLRKFKASVDPDTYGGAPVLGTRAVCMVGHGSSTPLAIKNGVLACAQMVRSDLPQRIADSL